MVKKPKHQWRKPQLIILARSTTNEVVLIYCKRFHVGGGPSYNASGCDETSEYPGCPSCATFGAS